MPNYLIYRQWGIDREIFSVWLVRFKNHVVIIVSIEKDAIRRAYKENSNANW